MLVTVIVMVMAVPVEGAFLAMLVPVRGVDLDLDRRMPDPEMLLQLPLHVGQEMIAWMPLRHDEMHRQRRFGRAHGPDVQVMNPRDAG